MTAPVSTSVPLLSVVIPTRNESGNIEPLWERLRTALGDIDFEVCFIDDSDDETTAVLAKLEEQEPQRVHCIFRIPTERTDGLSGAVVRGLRNARGQFVCIMDADLQHPPEIVPVMLTAATTGSDLVVASRYVRGGDASGLNGFGRRVVSYLARNTVQLLFREARQSTDPLSGFFLCRRTLIDGIEFRPVGFKILLELLVCVPHVNTTDVPLTFERRTSGSSKATSRQAIMFAQHLASLFFNVAGAARPWKFAIVGTSGLVLFLSLLVILMDGLRVAALVAFVPAFVLSVAWNTTLNRIWTFADQRRIGGGRSFMRYMERSLFSGAVMLALFAILTAVHMGTLRAGFVTAIAGMVINGVTNRSSVRMSPTLWTRIALDEGVKGHLDALAEQISADRVYIVPPTALSDGPNLPRLLLQRIVDLKRPTLWTEAASYRPQRRTNIKMTSTLVVPVIDASGAGTVLALVVCERLSLTGFEPSALTVAVEAAGGLTSVLSAAAL